MRSRRLRIFMLAAMLGGLLAACSGEEASGDDERPTRAEFIERADARCAEADAETSELQPPKKPREVEPFLNQARTITQDLVDDLRALPTPEGDEQTIDSMLDKVEEALAKLPALLHASEEKDLAAIQAEGQELQVLAQEAQRIASEYGFEVCGRVAAPAPAP